MRSLVAALTLLLASQIANAQGAFMFGGSQNPAGAIQRRTASPAPAPSRLRSPSPARPRVAPAPRVAPKPKPRPAPAVRPQERTEATFCANCSQQPARLPSRIDTSKVAGNSERRSPAGMGDACIRNAILESAKKVVAGSPYYNRPYSGGMCAQGVRRILNHSGVLQSGGMGDAVAWHINGTLKKQGFKDIMSQGINAQNAPPGAILIYRGPDTNMRSSTGGLPPRSRRRGKTAGNWVGHVTVKGERPGRYYTDGRTEAPAIARRTLVAVYVPEVCKNCRGAAAKCTR